MRTRHIYRGLWMTAAALLCLAGCKKDEEGEKVMLSTQFEKAVSVQKTYISDQSVCWTEGDAIRINNATEAVGVSNGAVEVDASESGYAVVYPFEGSTLSGSGNTCTGGTVTIPASQTYKLENGKQVLDGPMAARLDSKSGILHFKNLYSLLKVTVCADEQPFTVSYITIVATGSGAKPLAGTFGFSFNGATTEEASTAPTIGEITSGSTSVTLNCSSNNQVSANTDKDFYLAVLPLAEQNLIVYVHGLLGTGKKPVVYTHTTATTISLSRSRIGGIGINLQQLQPEVDYNDNFKFTVNSNGQQVTFSPGNLQWSATGTHKVAGGGSVAGTWRFAEHQWDYVGDATNGTVKAGDVKCDNASIASDYTGWIDLFGWGTSGWSESGATEYQPYATSVTYSHYYPGGLSTNNLTESCANADWGVYNAIYNPKTGTTDAAGTWRTLTDAEWQYLLGRGENLGWWIYNMVTIEDAAGEGKDVLGLIIYPDGVTAADLSGFTGKANFSQNSQTAAEITKAEFETLEAMGCVFLPAAGYRQGTSLFYAGSYGYYWSSTYNNSQFAFGPFFRSGNVNPSNYYGNRYGGHSVRLVKDVE